MGGRGKVDQAKQWLSTELSTDRSKHNNAVMHPLIRHYYPDSCFVVNLCRLERYLVLQIVGARLDRGSSLGSRGPEVQESATLRLGSQRSQRHPPSRTCHWASVTPKSEALERKASLGGFWGCDWADETLQLDRCIGLLHPLSKALVEVSSTPPPESRLTGWRGIFVSCRPATGRLVASVGWRKVVQGCHGPS